MKMLIAAVVLDCFFWAAAFGTFMDKPAQAPAPPKPIPAQTAPAAPRAEAVPFHITEVESLKLQLAQKDAILAQIQYQTAVGQFNAQIKAVHDAHGWPDSVQFNVNTMSFSGPPDAVAPKTGTPEEIPQRGNPPNLDKPTGPPVEPAKAK
jgi:hypothetical protein